MLGSTSSPVCTPTCAKSSPTLPSGASPGTATTARSVPRSRLTNALTGAPPVLTVARDGQGVVGWCAVRRPPSAVRRPEPGERRARMWGPVVDPAARRTGLGRRLLQTVVEAVEWPLLTTDVPLDRDGATDFFARSGWEPIAPAHPGDLLTPRGWWALP
ncbi:GNAT family N-acetyltransferase [Streptomyces violaceorubidus]